MRLHITTTCSGETRCRLLPTDKPKANVGWQLPSPLVLSSVLQDNISTGYAGMKSGYGWQPNGKRFTRTARSRLREMGALLDEGDLTCAVFLTGTLPGSTASSIAALARWSGWVISRLSQWLRDKFQDVRFFGVWEYQRRGALHVHVAVRCSSARDALRLRCSWKRRWASLLDGVSRRAGVDLWARQDGTSWEEKRWKLRTDAQVVQQSVARYLSKYLSKGSDSLKAQILLPPSTWWFASSQLRETALRLTMSCTVPYLSQKHGIELWERVSSIIASVALCSFPLTSVFEPRMKGLIAYSPPAVTGMLFREIRSTLSVLTAQQALSDGLAPIGRFAVLRMFDGLRLVKPSAPT